MHIVEAEVDDWPAKQATRKKTLLDWYEKAGVLGLVRDEFQGGKQPDLKPLFRLVDDMTATIRSKGYEPFLLLPLLGQELDAHLAHSVNVAVLSCALADAHGLNSGQINTVTIMAMLHDLGRLTIPVEWTQDHTPLSLAERKIARDHADWGYLLLTRNGMCRRRSLAAIIMTAAPVEGGYHGRHHRIWRWLTITTFRFSERYWKKQRRDRTLLWSTRAATVTRRLWSSCWSIASASIPWAAWCAWTTAGPASWCGPTPATPAGRSSSCTRKPSIPRRPRRHRSRRPCWPPPARRWRPSYGTSRLYPKAAWDTPTASPP